MNKHLKQLYNDFFLNLPPEANVVTLEEYSEKYRDKGFHIMELDRQINTDCISRGSCENLVCIINQAGIFPEIRIVCLDPYEECEEIQKMIGRRIPSFSEVIEIDSIGPKTAKILSETLNINTIEGLEEAAKVGRLQRVKGIGEKKEESILRSIEAYRKHEKENILYLRSIRTKEVKR